MIGKSTQTSLTRIETALARIEQASARLKSRNDALDARHARLRDAGIKTLGVLAGVALGYGLQTGLAWTAWRRSAQRDNKA